MITETIQDFLITATNERELRGLAKEIFQEHHYYFETEVDHPVVLDLGAHIGLTCLYFKKLYPGARITAVEPLPQNLALLQQNLDQNHVGGINLIKAAVAEHTGYQDFYFDQSKDQWFSTAGFTDKAWNQTQTSATIQVTTVTLASLLTQPIDLVKMDIEGSEIDVLLHTTEELKQIKHLIMEFHPSNRKYLNALISHLAMYNLKLIDDPKDVKKKNRKLQILEFSSL